MIPKYRILYKGDINTCNQYLPYAKNLLLQAYQTGQSVLKKRFMDATLIQVELAPAIKQIGRGNKKLPKVQGISTIRIEACACSIYMESGIIQWDVTGCGALESTYRPWQLLPSGYGGQGNFQGFDANNALITSGLLQGTESIAFGCRLSTQSETMSVTDCSGNPVVISGGGFCSTDLIIKKMAMSNVPPSVFSGLTKRYVQAMYGADRFDLNHVNAAGFGPELKITAVGTNEDGSRVQAQLRAYYPNIDFIARSDDFNYFYIVKSGIRLTLYALSIPAKGQDIIKKLRTNALIGDVDDQAESYALAYAKPDINNALAVVTISTGTLVGEPMAYTWHSNSNGRKHTIVLHEELPNEKMYAAREYELSLDIVEALDSTPGAFNYNGKWYRASASITQIGSTLKWNPKDYIVWGHDYIYGKMYWMSGGWTTSAETQTDDQVPLYSYYDGDTKIVSKITHTVSYRASSSSDTGVDEGCGAGASVDFVNIVATNEGPAGTKGINDLISEVHPNRTSSITTATASGESAPSLIYNAFLSSEPENCPTFNSGKTPTCNGGLISHGDIVEGDLCAAEMVSTTDPCSASPSGYDILNRIKTLWFTSATIEAVSHSETNSISGAGAFALVPYLSSDSFFYGLQVSTSMDARDSATYTPKVSNMSGGWDWYYKAQFGYCYPSEGWYEGVVRITTLFPWNMFGMTAASTTSETNVDETSYQVHCRIKDKVVPIASGSGQPFWMETLVAPAFTQTYKLIQNPTNAMTALGEPYLIEFVGSEMIKFNNNFGESGIGGVGWR